MKRAAQPAILQPAESEVGAAMGAVAIDQAVAPLLIAEQHEIFAEQLDGPHRPWASQLIHKRRRLPVHPHQFPARVLSPGAGDQVVRFLAHHGGGSCLGFVRLLNLWANYDMSGYTGKQFLNGFKSN